MNKERLLGRTSLSHAIHTILAGGLLLISLPGGAYAESKESNSSHLVVTSSYYEVDPIISPALNSTVAANPGLYTQLAGKTAGKTVNAIADGKFPEVFNNNTIDGSFGVTTPIYVSLVNSHTGKTKKSFNLTDIAANQGDALVTSFSSKSELAINLSTDGKSLTFMGYDATPALIDISNSNTPGVFDPTNPTNGSATAANGTGFIAKPTYRNVAQIDADGSLHVTQTNAYSGNNGRAAILDNTTKTYFMVGNAGNSGTGPKNATLDTLSADTGVESILAGSLNPTTSVVGIYTNTTTGNAKGDQYGFSITQLINPATGLPYAADKTGKDDNFRGTTVFNNTLYVTKGSGGNGVNTVYQVGNGGDLDTLNNTSPITILKGLPTILATNLVSGTGLESNAGHYPFGIWFADANTLYVADEGNGNLFDVNTPANKYAGLEKWVFDGTTWNLAYTLQNGLDLGVNYTVSGTARDGSVGSYTTATGGLRNLTGRVNDDGAVEIFATTSTVSTSGDQGADPNKLVKITDKLHATTLPDDESFRTLKTAEYGEVLRGVALVNEEFKLAKERDRDGDNE